MKRFALLLAVAVSLSGCGVTKRIDWPRKLKCIEQAGPDLLGAVADALQSDDPRPKLEQAALDTDSGLVACTVRQVLEDLVLESASSESAQSETDARAEANARAFLDDIGTEFE